MSEMDVLALMTGVKVDRLAPFEISRAEDKATIAAYRGLRRLVFVREQGLFDDDTDDFDDDPRTVVLVARDRSGEVVGGVRLSPFDPGGADIGWWLGSRLAVLASSRHGGGASSARTDRGGFVGPALIRAACAYAEAAGALRFEATVQAGNERMFRRLGWDSVRPVVVAGAPHVLMRWPIGRIALLASASKGSLGPLVAGLTGMPGFVGDDGVPVPGSDLIAACDAIVPSMVERDPEWAGWCAVLVNVNDLAAMGAAPVGLLDALGARDASFAARVLSGLRRASDAYGVPVLGGHTQLGVPASLSVTALGRAPLPLGPVPGGGGLPGQSVRLTVDLGGGWRPGYTGRQWDSTSFRSGAELRAMVACLTSAAGSSAGAARPAAAKDVSMAGIAGTLGMLAEASGCGAVLDVASVPRPAEATMGDWLTCFPGFGMLTTASSAVPAPAAGPAVSAVCGELVSGAGVRLRWPDGEEIAVLGGGVTGLGPASGPPLAVIRDGGAPHLAVIQNGGRELTALKIEPPMAGQTFSAKGAGAERT
jgi:putative N-acetyltransferase (TIGR04045 family)